MRNWQSQVKGGVNRTGSRPAFRYPDMHNGGLTMRLSDTRWRCRQSKLLNPHPPPPWIFTEAVPRDRSSRLLDVSQRVEFELLIEVIQQKIVVPTARALASNYARATEGRSQHTMTKHADNN